MKHGRLLKKKWGTPHQIGTTPWWACVYSPQGVIFPCQYSNGLRLTKTRGGQDGSSGKGTCWQKYSNLSSVPRTDIQMDQGTQPLSVLWLPYARHESVPSHTHHTHSSTIMKINKMLKEKRKQYLQIFKTKILVSNWSVRGVGAFLLINIAWWDGACLYSPGLMGC